MKKLLRKWNRRWAGRRLAEAASNYDRGYEDGKKEGYNKGRLSMYGVCVRVTTLEARIERLDKLLAELRSKGAGAERDKPFQ